MSNLNRTKVRRESTSTMPSALPLGEVAFNSETSELYVGTGTGKAKVTDPELLKKYTDVNNLVSKKAEKNDLQTVSNELNVQKARIDTFTSLAQGSTTGDAELIDARIDSESNTHNNVGDAIRSIEGLLKSSVLSTNIIADLDRDGIMSNLDVNGMTFVKYHIKKGDIYDISLLCEAEHSLTLVKSYPLDRNLDNIEIIRNPLNTINQRIVPDNDYVGFLIWTSNLGTINKIRIKKLDINDNVLKHTKIGTIDRFIESKVILEKTINLSENLDIEELNLKKGKFYRININTLINSQHTLVLSNHVTKIGTDTRLIVDNAITTDVIFSPIMDYRYGRFWVNNYSNNTLSIKLEEITFAFNNQRNHGNLIYVAASNSSDFDKMKADLVCTGEEDQDVINKAIASLPFGGTVKLLDGDYYIDTFDKDTKSAIYIGDSSHPRVVNIVGTTENKVSMSEYGVTLHVTDKAWSKLDDNTQYSVINSVDLRPPVYDWYAMQNNANFENFYIYFPDNQKKVIGINGYNLGSMQVTQVGIYDKTYWSDRWGHVKPTPAVEGCIGVLCPRTPNDEMSRIGLDIVNVGGLHTGIKIIATEHLIIRKCTISRGTYAFHFVGTGEKTLTMINCADEGNTHLWKFEGTGHLTAIDICIERLNADYIPLDINGDTDPYAKENTPKGWKGFISYVIQGEALGLRTFWKPGDGLGFKTKNLDNNLCGTTRPSNPDYLCEFFDTSTNKMLRWNGTNWVDGMGNIIE